MDDDTSPFIPSTLVTSMLLRPLLKAFALRVGLLDWYYLASVRREGPLLEDGWFRSFYEGKCVDRQGEPVPWLTYPALAFLTSRVNEGMQVFEYGCGNGTLWWARHARSVSAVENDPVWYQRVRALLPLNAEVCLQPFPPADGAYARSILADEERYHIVVIDGSDRVNCAPYALEALTPDGVIIWDDSEREEYGPGFDLLTQSGFRRLPFEGMTQLVSVKSETSIFYRDGNCLGI
ncbi:class I SAM-dependent methyltransferase [Geomesophilobacter sediminis]|uniref:FkbM family methyltransferase n=1 Tax=Geomesophilobacter sediminis TaxID=2798584 RepID=A0A8J7M099_9BACT|nr:hypothetical protein [Geomesophilobacter sediminis]MBJ6724077.1 hypothetical protein [Geomesophilobacter sediminis]